MSKIFLIGLAALVAGCSSPKPSTSEPAPKGAATDSSTPEELKSLVGAKGSSGEAGLQQAGYEYRNTTKTGTTSISYWSGKGGTCVAVTTADGRYENIATTEASNCNNSGDVAAASGQPGATRTVCGVIVAGKTTRYLCEVEENRQGTTTLRMPDTTLKLKWNLGSNSVQVEQDGMSPAVVKYSDSEGETNFRLDQRTFFYISNPGLAAMEVKNFKK